MIKKLATTLGLGLVLTTSVLAYPSAAPEVVNSITQEIVTDAKATAPFGEYVVKPGDTLSGIAASHNIDTTTLAYANGMNTNSTLRIGRSLIVPKASGAVHTVKRGDTLWDVARAYGASVTAIVDVNPHINASSLQLNAKILIPGAKPRNTAVSLAASSTTTSAISSGFAWPTSGRITSKFGPRWGAFHAGIDLGVRTGTNVKAARAGTVTFSGSAGGYGLLIRVSHGNGYETRYAHNSKLLVKAGDKVNAGQVIALSGNTGNSTGPHLHFEIRRSGIALNPVNYLR